MAADESLQLVMDSLSRFETKLDRGLERLETRLESKADKSDLTEIRGELTGQSKRISDLEREQDLRKAKAEVHRERDERSWFSRTNKWKIVGGIIASLTGVAIAAASVVGVILQLSH